MIKTVRRAPCAWQRWAGMLLGVVLLGFPGVGMPSDDDVLRLDPGGWRLVTDGVMGGVSQGRLAQVSRDGRDCLLLSGRVSTANNGGFIQAATDLPDYATVHIGKFTGLRLSLYGNSERYNVHLRTSDLWLPWQSYRATVTADPEWRSFDLPFTRFEPYRTRKALRPERLQRVGIVAIGRDFDAEVCIGEVGLFRHPDGP